MAFVTIVGTALLAYLAASLSRKPERVQLFSVGFVPYENLVGRANVIFFSISEGASPLEVWKWPSLMRPSRLFNFVN